MSLTRTAGGKFAKGATTIIGECSTAKAIHPGCPEEKLGRQRPLFSLAGFTLALPKRFPLEPRTSFRLGPLPLVISPFVPHGNVVGPFFLLRGH